MTTINSLPYDVLVLILSHCPDQDLPAIQRVSKPWKAAGVAALFHRQYNSLQAYSSQILPGSKLFITLDVSKEDHTATAGDVKELTVRIMREQVLPNLSLENSHLLPPPLEGGPLRIKEGEEGYSDRLHISMITENYATAQSAIKANDSSMNRTLLVALEKFLEIGELDRAQNILSRILADEFSDKGRYEIAKWFMDNGKKKEAKETASQIQDPGVRELAASHFRNTKVRNLLAKANELMHALLPIQVTKKSTSETRSL